MTTSVTRQLAVAAAVAACVSSGCGLSKQDRPAMSGPSEFGQSISVTATPDHISQDGQSQTIVQATIRDANGKVIPNVTVHWNVVAWRDTNGNNLYDGGEQTFGVLVEPSSQQSITDGAGIARISVAAPPAPVVLPADQGKLRITVDIVNGDVAATLNDRSAVVLLLPPAGTLPANRPPIAAFSISPAIGNINQEIRLDASLTTDEGELCYDQCSYQWDFGDFESASGRIVTKSYGRPETFTITLTVTDSRGGVGSVKQSLTINGPTPPVARLTITPSSAVGGTTLAFNGGGSTIGIGGTIVKYVWEFGDGTTATTTTPVTSHAYPVVPMESAGGRQMNYPVVLTIFDNFGRTSVATATATALPTPEP
jgi:hypothetical protein